MCFSLTTEITKQIADKDIICYKILNPNYKSYWRSFKYSLNKTYTTEIGIYYNLIKSSIINEGFHSYITDPFESSNVFMDKDENYYNISRENIILVKCIIPKGAEYYKNEEDGEYVSNKIKLIQELKYEI